MRWWQYHEKVSESEHLLMQKQNSSGCSHGQSEVMIPTINDTASRTTTTPVPPVAPRHRQLQNTECRKGQGKERGKHGNPEHFVFAQFHESKCVR